MLLAHIVGPTGSGKTTLGSKIKRVYPYILIKDIDDINRDLPSLYINEYIKTKNKKKFYKNFIEKGINKFLNDNKKSIIILVGHNGQIFDWDHTYYIDLNAKYKYFIDIPEEENLRRRFDRYINLLTTKKDNYFNAFLKNENPVYIDIDEEYIKIRKYDRKYFKKDKYKFLNNKQIFDELFKIINKIKIENNI